MALTFADLVCIGVYFVLLLGLAYLTRRTKTFQEFSIGKHSIPAIMIFASLAATIVGPGFSVGFTAKSWTSGYLYYYLVLGYALQVVLVGLFLAPRLSEHRDCQSIGDVMRKKYGRITQLLTGIVSVGLCIGFTAVMGKVGGATLQAVTGWPLPICLVLVTGTTALVTFSGGVRATIATEGMQFALMSIVIGVAALIAVAASPESFEATAHRADELTRQSAANISTWQLVGIFLSFTLGEALIPPYANRALAAKGPAGSKAGFVMAGLFCVVWLGMVAFLGVIAHSLLPAGTPADDVFVLIGRQVLPAGLFGLLLAAIIAIVMSSQESVLNSSAVAFVRDIVSVWKAPSQKMALLLAKASTLIFAAIAIYAAQFAQSIIDGLLILYSIWAPTILIPLIAGLYIRETRPLAGWLSILAGGSASLLWQVWFAEPHGIPAILVGLSTAIIAYLLGHIVGRIPVLQPQGEAA